MKPRTLASIGAVLLYVYCEVCQASPFAFVESGRRSGKTVKCKALPSDDAREDLEALFAPGKSLE